MKMLIIFFELMMIVVVVVVVAQKKRLRTSRMGKISNWSQNKVRKYSKSGTKPLWLLNTTTIKQKRSQQHEMKKSINELYAFEKWTEIQRKKRKKYILGEFVRLFDGFIPGPEAGFIFWGAKFLQSQSRGTKVRYWSTKKNEINNQKSQKLTKKN